MFFFIKLAPGETHKGTPHVVGLGLTSKISQEKSLPMANTLAYFAASSVKKKKRFQHCNRPRAAYLYPPYEV
jgi:hypothetical protein